MFKNIFIFILIISFSFQAPCGVVLSKTRVIISDDPNGESLKLTNTDDKVYLIQSIIDGEKEKAHDHSSFLVTPPLFRMEAKKDNVLQIIPINITSLNKDRESVFYLTIKAIPSTNKTISSHVSVVIQSKIKMFYRPSGLTSTEAGTAYKKLSFSRLGDIIKISNPTAYYITLAKLNINNSILTPQKMIIPFGSIELNVKSLKNKNAISWSAVTDYGSDSRLESTSI